MNSTDDLKVLIWFILIADIAGLLVYILKSNPVGIFNCLAWIIIAVFMLVKFSKKSNG